MEYAAYRVDGSKANEFKSAAIALFSNAKLKAELQGRMVNLDRATMSFDLDVRGSCPAEILDLAVKFGTGFNSYA